MRKENLKFILYSLSFLILQSCNYYLDKKNEKVLKKIEQIESIIGTNNSSYKMTINQVEYLFDKKIEPLKNELSKNIYCHTCDDPYSSIQIDNYHLNMEKRCFEYIGNCKKCNTELVACYSMIKKLDLIINIVEKN